MRIKEEEEKKKKKEKRKNGKEEQTVPDSGFLQSQVSSSRDSNVDPIIHTKYATVIQLEIEREQSWLSLNVDLRHNITGNNPFRFFGS